MIDKNAKLIVTDFSTDNGEHSHFGLTDMRTGEIVWVEKELDHEKMWLELRRILGIYNMIGIINIMNEIKKEELNEH
jgi:hypothetical protein